MARVKFTVAFPMFEPSHFLPMAKAAEECGFESIAVPDSVFYPQDVSAPYPYTDDGSRFWKGETPFVDPFVAVAAMAAVTERIRFYTNVVKLPLRHPLLVAKQVSSLAAMSDNRFILGVGLSWIPEEFKWTHTQKKTRGARTDEAIEIIRKVCAGGGPHWVEYHGRHYEFEPLMISPAPTERVHIWVGGHSPKGLRRAARLADGWISVNKPTVELVAAITELERLRREFGRGDDPFAISVLAVDAFEPDGFRKLEDLGVTHAQVVPWYFYGGDHEDLDVRRDSMKRFADEVITKL
jgi:probable F420-dependent oxidoreductase